MIILKSGLIYLKFKDKILISPYSNKTKKISSDKLEKIWKEMKYIYQNDDYLNLDIKELLEENNLIFCINSNNYFKYRRFSRNIQSLSNLNNNPFDIFSKIVNSRVLVIGAGTVGSAFVKILSKYGLNDISIIDGDTVSESNVTSQLPYDYVDVGESKVQLLNKKINKDIRFYNYYVNKDNLNMLFRIIKPEFVFCCADDSSLELQNLLIDNINNYGYKLFISGYSYSRIIVNFITYKDIEIFKNIYKKKIDLSEDNLIVHNTGTIIDGYLSSALMMNAFLDTFTDKRYNNFVFDKESFVSEKNYITRLSKEDNFNNYYEDFLSLQKNNDNKLLESKMEQYDELLNNKRKLHHEDTKIQEFHNLILNYNKKYGNFTEQYKGAIGRNEEIELIRQKIEKDVEAIFSKKYIDLINFRRKEVTNRLDNYLNEKFFINFRDIIALLKEQKFEGEFISSMEMLIKSINKIDHKKIKFYEAIEIIIKNTDSSNFKEMLIEMLANGMIDYSLRENKTRNNFTLFNPVQKKSNIIINYRDSVNDLMILSHELCHAFTFKKLARRLNISNFNEIDKSFWEVIANVGEMYILDKYKNINDFLFQSQYNLFFCIMDYLISVNQKDIESIQEIIKIKNNVLEYIGLNNKSLYYLEYNFMLSPFLYSNNLNNYNIIYQDILSIGLFEYLKSSGVNFEDFYKEVSNYEEFSLDYLMKLYNFNGKDITKKYLIKVLNSLKNIFKL